MTTLTASSAAAAMAAPAPVADRSQVAAASPAVRISDPTYQNGITRPRTRPPSARAWSAAPAGRRSSIGLTKTATANSTPTMMPTTVALMTASAVSMALLHLATLDFLALLDNLALLV